MTSSELVQRSDAHLAVLTGRAREDRNMKRGLLVALGIVAFPGWVPLTWPISIILGGGAAVAYLLERQNRALMVKEAEALSREQGSTVLSEKVLTNTRTTRKGKVLALLSSDVVREAATVRLESVAINARRHNPQ